MRIYRHEHSRISESRSIFIWSAFEPTAGTYNSTLFTNAGFGLDVLSSRGLKVLLTFPILDISNKTVPADLVALPLNDPLVKSRYRNAIAQILPYLNSDVVYII